MRYRTVLPQFCGHQLALVPPFLILCLPAQSSPSKPPMDTSPSLTHQTSPRALDALVGPTAQRNKHVRRWSTWCRPW
ncbi:hypothetical protein DEU56DRAFT_788142 [Suillus clintonianus]|uniref:uncharacterized protein n=1 Tax=Suillus clintonianus TaxID=1904413 RepID=UPI001B864400|nr:uncharacterized protein DEU56DRAFT_788142 [Suillus clintonianus]KAG2145812.1 hypothetical protein DEU56DRAFT_788142 [Suillus clintonianus]